MSIIVGDNTKVIVHGITGNEGMFHTQAMLRYGTKIVAGVTPGKGGQNVNGVPVYNSAADAVAQHGANTSIIFVPARFARDAALDAMNAGIKVLVIITEHVPQKDTIELVAIANRTGCVIIGPNCPGIMNPSTKTHIGIMPTHIFHPGNIGIISRSGTLTYEISHDITQSGMGQSTCVGIGGDPIIGLNYVRVLELFKNDTETGAVVLIGEIGGNAEEMAAQYIKDTHYPKPVIAYIAGRQAPSEKQMGHAGAIIMGDSGSATSKIKAFEKAGIPVAEKPSDIPRLFKGKI